VSNHIFQGVPNVFSIFTQASLRRVTVFILLVCVALLPCLTYSPVLASAGRAVTAKQPSSRSTAASSSISQTGGGAGAFQAWRIRKRQELHRVEPQYPPEETVTWRVLDRKLDVLGSDDAASVLRS